MGKKIFFAFLIVLCIYNVLRPQDFKQKISKSEKLNTNYYIVVVHFSSLEEAKKFFDKIKNKRNATILEMNEEKENLFNLYDLYKED